MNALLFMPQSTQRTKSKVAVARPAEDTQTLIKYIPIEKIRVNYGDFEREVKLHIRSIVLPHTELGGDQCKVVGKRKCCSVEDDSRIQWNSFWNLACHFLWMWRNKEVHDSSVNRPSAPWFWVRKLAKDSKQAVTFSDLLQYQNKT
ncbi:hypothetical protein MTR_2g021080 [Medicago truncatula]|uniref:Uncharacterized protein n=1 Tax=Medicago truncatula TaxID=3880 RepID=G7IFQ4_MEDTR|nr:hypothetical protein MTR_2g021080 [Medicago truncatula]